MTKRDLLRRIEALEERVAALETPPNATVTTPQEPVTTWPQWRWRVFALSSLPEACRSTYASRTPDTYGPKA